ncbi:MULTISPECIES: caspase family protein [unclassified Bradyrhizobium]|uniref:caspase family protein n=1 Tax=unclassified Bradyrhizobium TaxID=2631580 RepID=UPI0028E57892|nr:MULTISPECIES: caspase family protein [unclassified Bradyrhizobium]
MTLIADTDTKGLWTAADKPRSGSHALIVGVSDYPYLSGGSARERAPNSGGLGQLALSAVTAARVFDWFSKAGRVAGAPVASCRLLLAPSAGEMAEINRLTNGHFARPDFAVLRGAIEAWRDAIYKGRTGDENTAFFFFSGHGVEHLASPALLAADILDPNAAGSEARAVAIEAVARAVKTSGIDRALFFVDACRNAPALAMTLNIVGDEILKPQPFLSKSPDAVISLQSTRSGLQSFQVPGEDATIFGRALLEALQGAPPEFVPYDTHGTPWRLVFASLESHVKNRVRELLAAHTAAKIQPVEPSGIPYDGAMIVAERAPAVVMVGLAPEPPEAAPPDSAPPDSEGPGSSGGGPAPEIAWTPEIRLDELALDSIVSKRADTMLRRFKTFRAGIDAAPGGGGGDLLDFRTMHDILGHESVTGPFLNALSIRDAWSGARLSAQEFKLTQGRSNEVGDSLTSWIDVEIPPGKGQVVWFGVAGMGDVSFGVAIPRDAALAMPVRLDVGFSRSGRDWAVEQFSARLGEPRDNDVAGKMFWRPLWELQRIEAFSDLAAAGLKIRGLDDLLDIVVRKVESPVAAAIAMSLLLRSGNLDVLKDWPRNLASWFPWLPDGSILWAETLLRRAEGRPVDPKAQEKDQEKAQEEAFSYFVKSATQGPPLLTPSLRMAITQMQMWRSRLKPDDPKSDDPKAAALAGASRVIETAARHLVSGSLFASFARIVSADPPMPALTAADVLSRAR